MRFRKWLFGRCVDKLVSVKDAGDTVDTHADYIFLPGALLESTFTTMDPIRAKGGRVLEERREPLGSKN